MDEMIKMTTKKENQIIGVTLLVALILTYVPLPFISGNYLASIAVLICALYLLIKK